LLARPALVVEIDEQCAAEFGPADVVMMNGLLHHLDDDDALTTLRVVRRVLRPGGPPFHPRRLLPGWSVAGRKLAAAQ
jgi:Methyltransferase domain